MIQKFIDRFMNADVKGMIRDAGMPGCYSDLARITVEAITGDGEWVGLEPDPKRIHTIDDGDYQGTILFIIGAKGYQPSDYWSMRVGYGSCSSCDTLQSIGDMCCDDDGYNKVLTDAAVDELWTLCLHMVQSMKEV